MLHCIGVGWEYSGWVGKELFDSHKPLYVHEQETIQSVDKFEVSTNQKPLFVSDSYIKSKTGQY